jgi:hypothetical protein
MEHERPGLRAPESAVERDQLLEGTALVTLGVVEAADHDVCDVCELVRAQQMLVGTRWEPRERVVALDPPARELAAPRAAQHDRAALA